MIEIPNELLSLLILAVTAGTTWLVVEGIKELGRAFGKDFSKPAKVLAAVVSAGVVSIVTGVVNALLGFVPVEFAPVVEQVLGLLVVLFSAFGVHRRLAASG